MKFRITITELTADPDPLALDHEIKRYEHKPRKPRVPKGSKPA